MNKPPVLSDEEFGEWCHKQKGCDLSCLKIGTTIKCRPKAQRDADVEWYEREIQRIVNESIDALLADMKNPDTRIHQKILGHIAEALQQARQDTAREIFEEIEEYSHEEGTIMGVLLGTKGKRRVIISSVWQSLKSKYLGEPQ